MCFGVLPTWGVAATEVGPAQAASAHRKGDHPCIAAHTPLSKRGQVAMCKARISCEMALKEPSTQRMTHLEWVENTVSQMSVQLSSRH